MAEDCLVEKGEVPPEKDGEKTLAALQYEMIGKNPYTYTSDDVLFQCYALKNEITKNNEANEKELFFSKGRACFRASPLPKRYGWGIHYNDESRMALYGCETPQYASFLKDKTIKTLKAIRSKSALVKGVVEMPDNLASELKANEQASAVFAHMRPSCQYKYSIRASNIKNAENETSKMNTIIREIIRYGKHHNLL